MFFSDIWLKKGGRFYLCWLADLYPERLKGSLIRQLLSTDIRELSDDLQKWVSTESGIVKKRFSLRLSSKLLSGLIKLYAKKCSLLIFHLYNLNAKINHQINIKWMAPSELQALQPRRPRKRTIRLKLFTTDVQDEGEQVNIEEFASNTVARIEDITLRDPVLPDNLIPARDDFGELGEHDLGLDKMAEMMLAAGDPSALSVLDAERTNERLDRSRLSPMPPMPGHMERLTEFDITLRDATRVEVAIPGEDIEREIPEIPISEKSLPVPASTSKENRLTEQERAMEDDEFVLENISNIPLPPRKRRKYGKLIVDKETKLAPTAEWIAFIEGRTKITSTRDIIDIKLVSEKMLMYRPARAGLNIRTNFSPRLAKLFTRNCITTKTETSDRMEAKRRASAVRRAAQEALPQSSPPKQPRLDEDQTPAMISRVDDISKSVAGEPTNNGTDVIVGLNETTVPIEPMQLDIEQPLIIEPQHPFEKQIEGEILTEELLDVIRKSNILDKTSSPVQKNGKGLETVANREANIEDGLEMAKDRRSLRSTANREANNKNGLEVGPVKDGQTVRREISHSSSETQLGSLDRTKVSLGEPEELTESQISLKKEWGMEGTLKKIVTNLCNDVKPLTLRPIVESGSPRPGRNRIAVAYCFNSILNLKQKGFIVWTKNPVTNEIEDIDLGPRILEHLRLN